MEDKNIPLGQPLTDFSVTKKHIAFNQIMIFFGFIIFLMCFGIGVFHLGKQSALTQIKLSVSPTIKLISLNPTITSPASFPTQSSTHSISCTDDTECLRYFANGKYKCTKGICIEDIKTKTEPPTFYCYSDNDCILKDKPYCCGENIEYAKSCYHQGELPQNISCAGVGSCPSILQAESCKCLNNKCVNNEKGNPPSQIRCSAT